MVVVGKVTRLEDKKVSVPPVPDSKEKQDYQVAVVHIDEALVGAKGLTDLKAGFLALSADTPRMIRRGRPQPVTLAPDQEALFFLTTHSSGEFQVAEAYFDVIDKSSPSFAADVGLARRCAKLLAEPDKGLAAKEAEDRYLTAALLIVQYRTPVGPTKGEPKQQPIPAERSKKILQILAEADWTKKDVGAGSQDTPLNLFSRLGLTPNDGWNPPPQLKDYPSAAKAWVEANVETYRVKQFVPDKPQK
jgi:hypothetical protein